MRFLLFLFLSVPVSSLLSAQQLLLGVEVGGGHSWEIEHLLSETTFTARYGVEGGVGFSVSGLIGYRVGPLTLSFRPGLIRQGTEAYWRGPDDGSQEYRALIQRHSLLLPLYLTTYFGRQRIQPFVRVGGGLLMVLDGHAGAAIPPVEPYLPFAGVALGLTVSGKQLDWSPSLSVRNGVGELFRTTGPVLSKQRWAYVSLNLALTIRR